MEQYEVNNANETENALEENEGLTLDGEAWKSKDSTTYTSVLDLYGASDLFSGEVTQLYEESYLQEQELQSNLKEYVFSGDMEQEKDEHDVLVDYLFSEGVSLSKVKDYTTKQENYTFCLVLAMVLVGLIFAIVMLRYNSGRRKRRESFATEINMEGIRTE